MAGYNEALGEMENLNHAAATGFKWTNLKVLCRPFFMTDTKVDVIVNNLVETFSGYIIKERTKHLILEQPLCKDW